ncbi:MAG: EAL domain-containing protein, partial [Myxococcaceae bacterium]
SLVRALDADPARQALAAALVTFAGQIGALVIAEGVEESAELEALRRVGVSHAQGYHLSRPAPLPAS